MLELDIPGFGHRQLHHLVLDFNGTLALDGHIQPGVLSRLASLKTILNIHILTADTYGTVRKTLESTGHSIHVLEHGDENEGKANYVRLLGRESCVCMGNGNNDATMLLEGGLSMAILQAEGLAIAALSSAHLVVPGIEAALDLLLHPTRLKATLRH